MSLSPRLPGGCRTAVLLAGVLLVAIQTGCTSVLTTAGLRDLMRQAPDHAAEGDPAAPHTGDHQAGAASAAVGGDESSPGDQPDAGRRTAAIEEAVERLSRLGRLDAATEATLVETLQRTQPEDWPVVVDAFAAALPPPEPPTPAPVSSDSAIAAPASADPLASSPPARTVPVSDESASARPIRTDTAHATPKPTPAHTISFNDPVSPLAVVPPPPAATPEPQTANLVAPESRPALAIRNACFASRVRGWGDVERFTGQRFEGGQEVIVYFELDGFTVSETTAGFTTRIDTVLTLLGPDGDRIHAWRFDPLEETCKQRRRDYFARYLVVLPATASGRCRLEMSVSDALAATSAGATLPLDIVAAAKAGR